MKESMTRVKTDIVLLLILGPRRTSEGFSPDAWIF